jgi:hypothetical protein
MSVIAWWLAGEYSMWPVSTCFSMPPMRCVRPGVPGLIQGRAPFSSRF